MANTNFNSLRKYLNNRNNSEAGKKKTSTFVTGLAKIILRKVTEKYSEKFRAETNKMESLSKEEALKDNQNFFIDENGQPWIVVNDGETIGDIVLNQSESISIDEWFDRICEIADLNGLSLLHKIEPGDKFKVPPSVLPDITETLNSWMKEHAKDPRIANPFFFARQVRTGGDWDFKSLKGYTKNDYKYYIYNGEIIKYDAIGNIHYGYVGQAAPWSTEHILYLGAGTYQNFSDYIRNIKELIKKRDFSNYSDYLKLPEKNQNFPLYGDNTDDYYYVKKGIDLQYVDYYNDLYQTDSKSPQETIKEDDVKMRPYTPASEIGRKIFEYVKENNLVKEEKDAKKQDPQILPDYSSPIEEKYHKEPLDAENDVAL